MRAQPQRMDANTQVVDWLSAVDFQDDSSALPGWVCGAIPYGKFHSDASFDALVAKLCLQPEQVRAEAVERGGPVHLPAPIACRHFPHAVGK